MSNAVTALNGANYQGLATIADQGLTGMITLRGDLASAGIKAAVKSATGLDVPAQRQALMGQGAAALWMSPDELLLLCPYAEVAERLAGIEAALKGQHFLAVNVSDARTFLRIFGSGAREVLARGLYPRHVPPHPHGAGARRLLARRGRQFPPHLLPLGCGLRL